MTLFLTATVVTSREKIIIWLSIPCSIINKDIKLSIEKTIRIQVSQAMIIRDKNKIILISSLDQRNLAKWRSKTNYIEDQTKQWAKLCLMWLKAWDSKVMAKNLIRYAQDAIKVL